MLSREKKIFGVVYIVNHVLWYVPPLLGVRFFTNGI
jgi:hypothetical protein